MPSTTADVISSARHKLLPAYPPLENHNDINLLLANVPDQPLVRFGPQQQHCFINGYQSILNCPATCTTRNIIYVMTCPCHQADYIGETSLSLAERLLYHQEHGNRIVQEVLLGKKNVTRIRPELKSFETLVKDDMKLYQHSANCPAAIQWFLDENPAYWPFVPIKISEAEEFDEEREVAHSLEDTTQFTYANDIPTPPSGYRFTFEQKMAIEQFFQERKYINSPNYRLDLYHAAIVAICECDVPFRNRMMQHRMSGCRIISNFLIGTLVAERLRNDRDPDPYIPDYEKKLYAHSTQCSVPLQLFLKCHPEYWCFVPMTNEQVLIDNARVSPLEINLLNDYQNSLFTATQTSQYTRDMTLVQWCVNHVPSPPLNYQFSIRQKIQQYEFFSTKSDIYVTRFLDLYNPAIVLALPENASDALRRTVQALLVVYAEPKLVDTTVTHSETALQSTDIIEPTIWCQHLKLRLNSISKMAASDKDTMTTIDLTNNFNDVEWFDAVFDILDEEGDEDRDDILEEYNEDFDFDIRNKIFNEDMIECVEPKFMMANMDPDRKIRYEEIIPQKFKQILANNEERQRNVEENPLTSDENQGKSIPSTQSMPSKPLRSWDDDYVDSEQEEEEEEDNYPISNYDERLNEMFEKVMLDHLSGTTTTLSIQMLRELAMLQHEVAKIKLQKKLWNIYLKAGTGQWDTPESLQTNVDRGVWPIPIQNMIKFRLSESKTSVTKNERELGKIIVCEHLQVLDEKLQHILATYNTKKAQSIGVTDEIEKLIENFITRYSLVSYQMKLNYEFTTLLYDYDDQLLERTYLQMKPTDYQIQVAQRLSDFRYAYVLAKQDLIELKQHILCQRVTQSIHANVFACVSNSNSDSINDASIFQQQLDREAKILQEKMTDHMTELIVEAEKKIVNCRNELNEEIHRISIMETNTNESFPEKLMTIIGRRINIINKKLEYIYKFRFNYFLRHQFDDIDDSLSLVNVRFSPSLIIDTPLHFFTNEQIKFLNRGPTYVPPYQVHVSSLNTTSNEYIEKTYKFLQHQLTILYDKYKVNMAQSLFLNKRVKDAYTNAFSITLPRSLQQRAFYEKQLVESIKEHLKENNLILRRTADQSNVFYLGFRPDEFVEMVKEIERRNVAIQVQISMNSQVQFMDAYIENKKGILYTRVQHDSTVQKYTLPYVIGNSRAQHSHWLRSSLIRAVRYCTSVDDFNRERIYLETTCLANGYSLEFVETRIDHFYRHFDALSLRTVLDENVYKKLRHRLFNYISEQRQISENNRELAKKNERVRLSYLHEYGPKEQFNQELRKTLSANLDASKVAPKSNPKTTKKAVVKKEKPLATISKNNPVNDPILSTSPQGMRAATISSSQELRKNSYHPKIETFLSRWRQLQEEKNQCQKQQEQNIQQLDQKPQEQWQRDDFDRLIEEDLENQLKELERQEDEQYRLLEQSLEEELRTEQCSLSIQSFQHDFSKELHHMATLIQSEQNEQQQQYDTVSKALEKYKQYDILKKFETDFHLYTKIISEEMHTSQKFSQLFTSANEQQKKKDDPTRRNPTVSYSELNLRQLIGFDIDKVPQYLNHTNDSFQKIIHSIRPTMTVNRLEELRHIAILMYKLFLLEKLELLWTMYRRSGTGNLELSTPIEQMNRNIWPKEVRTRIELIHNKHISNNNLYLTFVEQCLGKLYEKNEECQRQLRYRTGHLVDYTWAMEETIKKFVQQGFMYQSVEYACQIALVQYNYREAMAKQQFLHENPNQNQ
ncbi:unnamed protein product, partial [Rotaria sp. Silwood1]